MMSVLLLVICDVNSASYLQRDTKLVVQCILPARPSVSD